MAKSKKAEIADSVEESIVKDRKKDPEVRFDKVLSTGSTLLDLAISGGRTRGGGLPGGIVIEIYGPSALGKTAILSEIVASAQIGGGDAHIADPEGRFDKEYSRIYGVKFDHCGYSRPDTVKEIFDKLYKWKPKVTTENSISVFGADSLAALSTELEMGDGDSMGMKRGKDFSEGLRKTARLIANNNWLVPCTNQEREGPHGVTTSGGRGIPYYASVRIRLMKPATNHQIVRKKKIYGVEQEIVDGIRTVAKVTKNSIDSPFRTAKFSITYSLGIDNVRDNIEYLRENKKVNDDKEETETERDETKKKEKREKILLFDQEFSSLVKAIQYVEDNNLETELENQVIDLWEEIQDAFKVERKRKIRK